MCDSIPTINVCEVQHGTLAKLCDKKELTELITVTNGRHQELQSWLSHSPVCI